jgi:phosphoribosylamine---glycine ligase
VTRVLIVGAGGREHALAWRLSRDRGVEIHAAPGNDGILAVGRCHPVPESDHGGLERLCRQERIGLVVIGPEAPLAAGLADHLRAAGNTVFGPSAESARLESSKWHAKQVMAAAGVPTARAIACGTHAEVERALDQLGAPHVIKADGLAAGKGVMVTAERSAASQFARDALESGRFGAAGSRIVVEEHLAGEEVSVMAVCDGVRFALLPPARDYKRAHDADQGANTGGMGAYAPSAAVDSALESEIGDTVVAPVLRQMARQGAPYRGVLYCGLMLTDSGPRVLEFNCRFGDPETEVVVPLVEGSFAGLLDDAASGGMTSPRIARAPRASVAIAIVDDGYPDQVRGGGVIEGLDMVDGTPGLHVFIAGAAREGSTWRVRGGRAAYVVAEGDNVEMARERAYAAVGRLGGSGWRCRRDVAAGAARAPGARSAGGV